MRMEALKRLLDAFEAIEAIPAFLMSSRSPPHRGYPQTEIIHVYETVDQLILWEFDPE